MNTNMNIPAQIQQQQQQKVSTWCAIFSMLNIKTTKPR